MPLSSTQCPSIRQDTELISNAIPKGKATGGAEDAELRPCGWVLEPRANTRVPSVARNRPNGGSASMWTCRVRQHGVGLSLLSAFPLGTRQGRSCRERPRRARQNRVCARALQPPPGAARWRACSGWSRDVVARRRLRPKRGNRPRLPRHVRPRGVRETRGGGRQKTFAAATHGRGGEGGRQRRPASAHKALLCAAACGALAVCNVVAGLRAHELFAIACCVHAVCRDP